MLAQKYTVGPSYCSAMLFQASPWREHDGMVSCHLAKQRGEEGTVGKGVGVREKI